MGMIRLLPSYGSFGRHAVRRLATKLVRAWILTIPAAGLMAAAAYWLGRSLILNGR